ncbi:MAG: hydantoinase/oxoprolinase family protein [Gammaproteobacteria bacterium]|nr:hydantoinase/oxoprolinase family protein [Gammaproteobacteria bacterium]
MARIGVDVGGTFTDLILECGAKNDRAVFVHKVPSTTSDQSIGVVQGILELCEIGGIKPGDIDLIVHGTTIATNIVIEHAGAEVGMLTTRGYRDILHLARHKRPHNFSLQFELPWQKYPLVKRRNRVPITERVMPPDGRIEVPLAEDEVRSAAELLKTRNVDAVIVGFLFSFLNDAHEQRAKAIVQEILPDTYVNCSSEVVNVLREYERFSTAAMNGYIGPSTARYLRNLERTLSSRDITAPLRVMQSNGGIATVATGLAKPVTILMSGPAGGVIGGKWAGERAQETNLITVDIGGTSADISVIPEGRLRVKNPRDTEVNGYPVLVPMIDITTIGAGGGSIAYIDEGGAFRVGPRSAGADPGPACYARGGSLPTVTDAQVALGRLDPEHFLGGDLHIDAALATAAIKDHLCAKLDMSVLDAALGVIRVINSNMALAIRANSVARGIDPREFALMPFGGAGPLHAVALASAVAVREIIVPPAPGITAAMGLLAADMQYEFTRSTLAVLTDGDADDLARLNQIFDDLLAQAQAALAADGVPEQQQRFQRLVECRYQGQGFELRAEVPDAVISVDNLQVIVDNFHAAHRADYGHSFESTPIEVITLRVVGYAPSDRLSWPDRTNSGGNVADALLYTRPTTFDNGQTLDTPRYERARLSAGQTIVGPAIIVQHDSTSLIPSGYDASVKASDNIHILEKRV